MVLRASSLAAVTSLVWSTRLNPTRSASARAACRTATTSAELRISRVSWDSAGISVLRLVQRGSKQGHPALHVERGPHSGKGEAKLYQRNGDGRLHPDHYGCRIEHPGHRGNVREHAADERIDDLERGDVDQNAPGAGGGDPGGEVLLERHG